MVAAVELDDQLLTRVERVQPEPVPLDLKVGAWQAVAPEKRPERVVERALRRRLTGVDEACRAWAARVQTREAGGGEVAVAAGFVDRAGQLDVGESCGDVGDRARGGRDLDATGR